jgi:hypothetical protein
MDDRKTLEAIRAQNGQGFVSTTGIETLITNEFHNTWVEKTGFCNNVVKFSYIISAPLHMKGFWQFWYKNRPYGNIDRIAVTFDLLIHLSVWIIPLVLELWCNGQDQKGDGVLKELMSASLWALIVALSGIAIAQFFAMLGGGQEAGKLFPTTYGAIVGGAYSSIVFTVLWAIYATAWTAMNSQYVDNSPHDDLKVQRQCMLWSLALKIFAVVTLVKNADFWGPCVVNPQEENKEKVVQFKENMAVAGTPVAQLPPI